MGGPCKTKKEPNKHGVQLKIAAPACTDNFQLATFVYDDDEYHSVEQAYQACKFTKGKSARTAILALKPSPGESASAFGMRCWNAGQTGQTRSDWCSVKVQVMYDANVAKYEAHEQLRHDLLSTLEKTLYGGPSTSWSDANGDSHKWQVWNALVQMRIREELRPEDERDVALLSKLVKVFEDYKKINGTKKKTKIKNKKN